MKSILTLAAVAALSLSTVASSYAQEAPANLEEVNSRSDLTDNEKAALLGISLVVFLGLLANSGGTSGT